MRCSGAQLASDGPLEALGLLLRGALLPGSLALNLGYRVNPKP